MCKHTYRHCSFYFWKENAEIDEDQVTVLLFINETFENPIVMLRGKMKYYGTYDRDIVHLDYCGTYYINLLARGSMLYI